MLLSELVGKSVYSGNRARGVLNGVCLSLKSRAVKYLLCTTTETNAKTEFAVTVSSIQELSDTVRLKRLKAVLPKQCARVFLNRPIYSEDGAYLGHLADLESENYTATKLICGDGKSYPAQLISALNDAVILRKAPPYPIGQRIPAPHVFNFLQKTKDETSTTEPPVSPLFVSKNLLKIAAENGELIRLTAALPPFSLIL